MVHSNKLVVSLKVDGKFLRDTKDPENNNEVFVPFGTEYSIYLKNLHSQRALVDIDVDGESAITGLVIGINSHIELERFHKGNNSTGHRFKFIEKTQKISEHRGDGPEDGLIVISYRFEKPKPTYTPKPFGGILRKHSGPFPWTGNTNDNYSDSEYIEGTLMGDLSNIQCSTRGMGSSSMYSSSNISDGHSFGPSDVTADYFIPVRDSDAGITVEGSQSNQSFVDVSFGEIESISHSIVLKLRGVIAEQKVIKPLLARTRVTCKTCGKKCETTWSMCPECGTNVRASATTTV